MQYLFGDYGVPTIYLYFYNYFDGLLLAVFRSDFADVYFEVLHQKGWMETTKFPKNPFTFPKTFFMLHLGGVCTKQEVDNLLSKLMTDQLFLPSVSSSILLLHA